MKYYQIEPAIPGELGQNSVLDHSVSPPVLLHLHYELDDQTEEPIFTSHPAYVVSAEAKEALAAAGLSGFQFDKVEISTSPAYVAEHGSEDPGAFFWIKIDGQAGKDDFGIDGESQNLIVSQRALDLLEELELDECEVEPFEK